MLYPLTRERSKVIMRIAAFVCLVLTVAAMADTKEYQSDGSYIVSSGACKQVPVDATGIGKCNSDQGAFDLAKKLMDVEALKLCALNGCRSTQRYPHLDVCEKISSNPIKYRCNNNYFCQP